MKIKYNNGFSEILVDAVDDVEKFDISDYKSINIDKSTIKNLMIVDRDNINSSGCYIGEITNYLEVDLKIDETLTVIFDNISLTSANNGFNIFELEPKTESILIKGENCFAVINGSKEIVLNKTEGYKLILPEDDNFFSIKIIKNK